MATIRTTNLSEILESNRWSAEYFDPKYVFQPNNKYKWIKIGNILTRAQYGLSMSMNEENIGVPMYRMNEIENCFVKDAKKYAITTQREFENYRLERNDILFNRTNSFEFVGRTGILKHSTDSVFASYLIRLNTKTNIVLPDYLTVYLNTKFGIGQIKRRAMRSVNQANVSATEIKQIEIPILTIEEQLKIQHLVESSYEYLSKFNELYAEAEAILNEKLEINKISKRNPKGYSCNFSEIAGNRFDSEYFQPKFKSLEIRLNELKTTNLGTIVDFNKGIEVGSNNYVENGILFIRVSNLDKKEGIVEEGINKYISPELYHSLLNYKPKKGSILISKDGSAGIAYTIQKEIEGIFSGGIVELKLKDKFFPSEYLSLVINSTICQMQIERDCSGALILHWKPEDIKKLQIPLLDRKNMMELNRMVKKAKCMKYRSEKLLMEAINMVDALIQEAID